MIQLLSAGSTATRSSRSRTRSPRTTPRVRAFTRAVGDRVQIVGDDFLVTERARVASRRARRRQRGAAQAQPARHAHRDARGWDAAREVGYAGIVSARSGETEDVTIVHLAVGWGVGQLKVGSFARGERMAKWNEALRIEEALGARAGFAGGAVLGRVAAGEGALPLRSAGPELRCAARVELVCDRVVPERTRGASRGCCRMPSALARPEAVTAEMIAPRRSCG